MCQSRPGAASLSRITFRFDDNPQETPWGKVSGGVNTSVFAKVDVAFASDLTGVGGKAGMRSVW
jgi:hypothetical protein